MKKLMFVTMLIAGTMLPSIASAQETEAPNWVLQGSATWTGVSRERSAPWLGTEKNPSRGELMLAHRWNLKSQVILLELQFSLAGEYENVRDNKLITGLTGVGIGPTARINYGSLHTEAGVSVGPRGYLFGSVPGKMQEDSNGYALASWGVQGQAFLRLGLGPVFIGGSLGLEKAIGGVPGEQKPAIAVDVDTNNLDANVDSSNAGKVPRVDDETRANFSAIVGFCF